MRFCSNKDIDMIIRQLVGKGWTFRKRKKHGQLLSPQARGIVTVSVSPSDYRALKKIQRDIQHASGL